MITIDDIIKRSRYINCSTQSDEYIKYHNKTKLLLESNIDSIGNIKFVLQHWQSIDENQVECFKSVIDILDEAYENDNINNFNYIKSYIIEEITPTVRDAKQTARYLKYKTTRMKNKITEKLKKSTETIKDATRQYADNIKNITTQSISSVKTPTKKDIEQKDVHEAYVQILDALDKYNHCDRILENANTIQKRFNIMGMVERTDISDDIKLAVLVDSICECINTYDIDFSTRFNSIIETCFYFLGRTKKPYNKSLVLEQIVDNFICKDFTDSDLNNMKSIIESTVVCDPLDKINIEYIYTTTPYGESVESIKDDNSITIKLESDFVMDFGIYESVEDAKETVKDIINSFKLRKMKKATDVRTCVSKMFTKSPNQIIDGTPNFLSWIRLSWVIGATSIHPILGAISLLVDQFIAMNLKRRDISKMITVFKNERKAVAAKLEKADEKDKKNLKEYDKYLKDGISKLEEYQDSLLSEKEKEAKDTGEEYDKDSELDFLKDDEDDFNLEATSFEKLVENSDFFSRIYFANRVRENISIMDEDTIDTITEVSYKYPIILSPDTLYNILNEELQESKKNWVRVSCLSSNMRKVHPENGIITTTGDMTDLFEVINDLEDLFVEYSISKTMGITNESVSGNVKMLANKLKKTMQKASDIDKEASRKIDTSVNTFVTSMYRASRNNNREAIIRGSILPSASKIVKAAILDTGVALIDPALAIILALGQFAVNKKMKIKERQLVLDEIEIELEMCKRYLRQAEDQNDLEAQKKILRIERNLERQRQRIKYNMKMHWNQDIPSTPNND